MTWIQNFIQFFTKEVDDVEITRNFLHNAAAERADSLNELKAGKEADVRISYQYPKSNIILPISAATPVRKKIRNERNDAAKKSGTAQAEPVKEYRHERKSPQTAKVSRGPFHPTEIPSPVYGFNRPERENPLIEHEISHFSVPAAEPSLEISVLPAKIRELMEENDAASAVPEDIPETISAPAAMVDSNSEEKQSRPKRAHLPFNVMMLKQDRQRWEDSKRRRQEKTIPDPNPGRRSAEPQVTMPEPGETSIEVQMTNQNSKQDCIELQVTMPESKPMVVQPDLHRMEPQETEVLNRTETSAASREDGYLFPDAHLLNPPVLAFDDHDWINSQTNLLNQTLLNFNVGAKVVNVTQGPSVTRFEVHPEPGVKVNKITNLNDDIKLSLAAKDIRIEAPIPGKHTIGIEVPNKQSRPVYISEIIENHIFEEASSPLTAVLGLDISGKPIVTDLKKMPHGLIAGATGSGKSVCINTILVSLLYKARPEDLKLLLIDPKMVELAPYNHIPHLVSPVITDVKAATAALKWAVEEMERRYELFAHTGVRDISRFNELALQHKRYSDKLPFIVIIIDELADLMMMSPADVEEAICRIAQKARACGIHLIVATQRPSVDVITGLIKANIPTRISFSVSSQIDSRTIIDISGAEKLLGRGDMLFLENGSSKPVRLQGTFVSDEEIEAVVAHVREQQEPEYLFQQDELLKKAQISDQEDELFYEACEFIIDQGGASTSSLQRRFKIGYNRAARLMDLLEKQGFISGANGSKPREVLITESDLIALQES